MGAENAKQALERSLNRLQTDYIDIYMMHWPRQTGEIDEDWKSLDLETWQAMEEMVRQGKVRKLGLSNFLPHHLKNILENCTIKPVADQDQSPFPSAKGYPAARKGFLTRTYKSEP